MEMQVQQRFRRAVSAEMISVSECLLDLQEACYQGLPPLQMIASATFSFSNIGTPRWSRFILGTLRVSPINDLHMKRALGPSGISRLIREDNDIDVNGSDSVLSLQRAGPRILHPKSGVPLSSSPAQTPYHCCSPPRRRMRS